MACRRCHDTSVLVSVKQELLTILKTLRSPKRVVLCTLFKHVDDTAFLCPTCVKRIKEEPVEVLLQKITKEDMGEVMAYAERFHLLPQGFTDRPQRVFLLTVLQHLLFSVPFDLVELIADYDPRGHKPTPEERNRDTKRAHFPHRAHHHMTRCEHQSWARSHSHEIRRGCLCRSNNGCRLYDCNTLYGKPGNRKRCNRPAKFLVSEKGRTLCGYHIISYDCYVRPRKRLRRA